MHFNVCVILKLPSADICRDWLRNYVDEQLCKYDCQTKNKEFLKRKQVKLSDYKSYYADHYKGSGRFETFEGWMDYIGCYKDENVKWCVDVNPNGHYDFYEIIGEHDGFIPTKGGQFVNICPLKDVLLRREEIDDSFVKDARTLYDFMTWELPADDELSKEFENLNGKPPTEKELEEYKNQVSASHINDALAYGCDSVIYGAATNRAKYPTFDDYLEKCRCFVPYTYVCDGEWVERAKLFYFHSDETHKKIKDFIKDFHSRVNKILKRDDADEWYAVAVDAHK